MCFFLPCIRCGSFMHKMCFFDAYDVAQHSKVCIKACIALCHENDMVWDWTIVDEVRNLHPNPNRCNLQWVPMQLSEKGRSESALACYPIMPGCKPQCQRYLRACMVVTAETRPHDSAACLWSLQVFFAKRAKAIQTQTMPWCPRINSRTRCWVEEAATTKPQQRLKKQEICKQTISCFGYLLIYHDSSELPSQPPRSRVRRPKNSRQPWQGVRRVAE